MKYAGTLFIVNCILTVLPRVATQWASHHDLTSQQFQTKFNTYVRKGYRLTLVDGYLKQSSRKYSGIWEKKSGPAWRAHHGMSTTSLRRIHNNYRRQGYQMMHLDGGDGQANPFFSAIWVKKSSPPSFTHWGMSSGLYQAYFNWLKRYGYHIAHVSGYTVGGVDYYAAIWKKEHVPSYIARHAMSPQSYQSHVTQYLRSGYRLVKACGYMRGNSVLYAGLWQKLPGRWSARHALTSLGYQNEFDNHLFTGSKMTYMSACSNCKQNSKTLFIGIWADLGHWNPTVKHTIEKRVSGFMRDNSIRGVSIALVKNGKLVYSKGFGKMNNANNPTGAKTLFRVASVSKPITGAAVVKLAETTPGLLSKKVFGPNSILGNDYGVPDNDFEKQVTVEHLLKHTAGGNAWGNCGTCQDPMFRVPHYNFHELISWVLRTRNPTTAPGSVYSYSNFGYCVLGRVIEKLTRKSYVNYVKDAILKPSGISDMEIGTNTAIYNEATYYDSWSGLYTMPITRMDSHGGWIASSVDLMRFLVRFDGFNSKSDLISPASFQKMTQGSTPNPRYGMGWAMNGRNYYHNGALPGTGAMIVRAGNRGDLSWMILFNKRWVNAADSLMWNIVNGITSWPAASVDYFNYI